MKKAFLFIMVLAADAIISRVFLQGESSDVYRAIPDFLVLTIVVLVGGTFYFLKNKSQMMSILRIFTGGFRMKKDSGLSPLEEKKILTGALYSHQQGAYLNSLNADIDSGKLYTILGEWWGIEDSESARNKLDYLQNKGFNYYFPIVWQAFHAESQEEQEFIILNNMTNDEDIQKAFDQLSNLKESIDIMKNLKVINDIDDIKRYGVIGWDTGRNVFVARLCYDAKYINENEAWGYINPAYDLAQTTFNSWEDLSKSYIIGRFLWGGKDANNGMDVLAEELLTKDDSPWKTVAWK